MWKSWIILQQPCNPRDGPDPRQPKTPAGSRGNTAGVYRLFQVLEGPPPPHVSARLLFLFTQPESLPGAVGEEDDEQKHERNVVEFIPQKMPVCASVRHPPPRTQRQVQHEERADH